MITDAQLDEWTRRLKHANMFDGRTRERKVAMASLAEDSIELLLAEVEKTRWHEIETAPTDGTHVLVVISGWVFVAYQKNEAWWSWPGHTSLAVPSHWAPLPPLPEAPE